MFHIVLLNPEIPHNTGAAGRLALATGSKLHLVKPLGFELSDRALKRAGLDYWKDVDLEIWENWEAFCTELPAKSRLFPLTTKAKKAHWDASFQKGDYLLFGRETKGLPEAIIEQHKENALRIPMRETSTRSLNLATSISIVLYEALRQSSNTSEDGTYLAD